LIAAQTKDLNPEVLAVEQFAQNLEMQQVA
jgi:hypothetical protein